MSGLVQSVAYRRLPMMLAYSVCLTPSPVFLKSFTLGSYGASRFTVKVFIFL
ncbi:hypothetical protein Lalb_Chr23g0270381 [Lupinus albus]|uniref:Uncharacterized protein n=1 Tax=Lupinus albus TaxID=3870 RepID=A0A6A4NCE1_LUPAL|nr:hypothetical protein Lalb_Chr23g0270381 [Lupinus albus]